MVRGRYVRTRDGSRVWREWAPEQCPVGHRVGMRPGHGECPRCRVWMGRIWRCSTCDVVVVDPDHRCGTAAAG